jgi:nucleotide-binding universal stress UspA family protein
MATRRHVAVWVDNDEQSLAGTLCLSQTALVLEGTRPGRQTRRRIRYGSICRLHLGRTPGERVGGRIALVVDLGADRRLLRIASPQAGALSELIEELAMRTDERSSVMRRIVIATDGSRDATRAVREGLDLASKLGADVTFVAVRTPPNAIWGAPVYQAELETATQIAGEAIDDAIAIADQAGIDADYEILDGPAADSIDAVAEARDADYIVVGSRGRGAVKGALFGSVSKALVTHSQRPVLVVKEPKHARVPA